MEEPTISQGEQCPVPVHLQRLLAGLAVVGAIIVPLLMFDVLRRLGDSRVVALASLVLAYLVGWAFERRVR